MKWKSTMISMKLLWLGTFKKVLQQGVMLNYVEGIYQKNWDEGDSKFIEKVTIRQVSGIAEMYKIVKITWKGNCSEKEVHKEKADKWIATYDYSTRQLERVDGQSKCSFLPEKLLLFVNSTRYKKIKSF